MKINRKYFNFKTKPWTHELSGSQKPYRFLDDITFESEPVEVGHGFFIDYGVKHYTDEGQSQDDMEETTYTPMKSPDWAINRVPYPPFFPEHLSSAVERDYEVPPLNVFWNMVIAARKFEFLRGHEDYLHKNKEDCLEARKNLLINLLGFKDTGVSVGGDLQFLYQFSSKWSQVEIYLSTKDPGIVTELVMYDQTNRIEVRFPIRSIESLIYLFLQVCGDIYHWDFEKLELFEEDEYWVNDFKSTFDFMDIPTTDFIKYIMNGGLIFNYPE